MLNSRAFDYRIWVTLILSLGFGLTLNKVIPILSDKPFYLLALPFGVLFFALLIIKPKWFLVLLFLSRPLLDNVLNLTKSNLGDGQGVGLGAVLNLAIIVLAIFLSFYYIKFPYRNKVVLCWFIFLFLMFVSVWYSPYRLGALKLYFNYLSYFAAFIIPLIVIETKEDFLFWFKILAWSFILPIFGGDIDLIRGGHYYIDAGQRIGGTFTHPNILAFYLVLGLTIYFYILKSGCWKLKPILVWSMGILILNMLVLLITTKTRNAWIACLVVFFVYGFLKDKKFLITLLLVLPLSILVPQVQDRVLTILQGKESNDYKGLNSFEWRLHMWESSLPMIKQRPLQGYGLTSFKLISEQFSDLGPNSAAHNAYLATLFETGIFGLLSFIFLLLSPLFIFFKNMRKSINQNHAKLWAIVVGYVASYMVICFGDNLSYYLVLNWYVWFFIGIMMVSEKFINDAPFQKIASFRPQ